MKKQPLEESLGPKQIGSRSQVEKKNAFICINSSLLSEPKWAPGPEGSSPEPCRAVRAARRQSSHAGQTYPEPGRLSHGKGKVDSTYSYHMGN